MAPGGEGEGRGGRKVKSPKAQAEEETQRREGLGKEAWEAERAGD